MKDLDLERPRWLTGSVEREEPRSLMFQQVAFSVLPVPVTLKLSFQLTPYATLPSYYRSVHWKHLLVCGGKSTALSLAAPTSSIACACLLQFLGGYSIWSTASITLCNAGAIKPKMPSPIYAWNCWTHSYIYILISIERRCPDGSQWRWPSTSISALTLGNWFSLKQTLVTSQPLYFLRKHELNRLPHPSSSNELSIRILFLFDYPCHHQTSLFESIWFIPLLVTSIFVCISL